MGVNFKRTDGVKSWWHGHSFGIIHYSVECLKYSFIYSSTYKCRKFQRVVRHICQLQVKSWYNMNAVALSGALWCIVNKAIWAHFWTYEHAYFTQLPIWIMATNANSLFWREKRPYLSILLLHLAMKPNTQQEQRANMILLPFSHHLALTRCWRE